jgi:hypothetical protein
MPWRRARERTEGSFISSGDRRPPPTASTPKSGDGGKAIAVMPHSTFLVLPVAAGDVALSPGALSTYNNQQNKKEEVWTLERGEAALKIKAGYVYYVQLTVSYRARLRSKDGACAARGRRRYHRRGPVEESQVTALRAPAR